MTNFIRNKPKKKRSIIVTILKIIAIISVIGLAVVIFVFYRTYSPYDKNDTTEYEFIIKSGEGVNQVSASLVKMNLLGDNFYFDLYLWAKGREGDLKTGTFYLKKSMSPATIADVLTGENIIQEGKITIPEGYTNEQIAAVFAEFKAEHNTSSNSSTSDELINKYTQEFKEETEAVVKYKNSYDFLQTVPSSATLEGFLFPDTYRFFYNVTAEEVVTEMLDNFDKKLTTKLREDLKSKKTSIFDMIIVASITQKEVTSLDDMKKVAGVYYNRVNNNMKLESDATITYITKKETPQPSFKDTRVESPYNTYLYKGLPPGPVSNPGLDAITAAIYPAKHNYLFFITLLDDTGQAIFAETAEGHIENKAKYLD